MVFETVSMRLWGGSRRLFFIYYRIYLLPLEIHTSKDTTGDGANSDGDAKKLKKEAKAAAKVGNTK